MSVFVLTFYLRENVFHGSTSVWLFSFICISWFLEHFNCIHSWLALLLSHLFNSLLFIYFLWPWTFFLVLFLSSFFVKLENCISNVHSSSLFTWEFFLSFFSFDCSSFSLIWIKWLYLLWISYPLGFKLFLHHQIFPVPVPFMTLHFAYLCSLPLGFWSWLESFHLSKYLPWSDFSSLIQSSLWFLVLAP